MPTQFVVFPASNRDPGTVYDSATVTVPNDLMVKFVITNMDMVNEPDTTIIYWGIQRAPTVAGPFVHMVAGAIQGCGGVPQPKPPGVIACTIDGVVGQAVRGSLYFVSAGDQRKRFGVSGETY